MGQAFDERGNVLGEATGPTKSDVLKALEESHPHAAEIRITSVERHFQQERERQTAAEAIQDPLLQFFTYTHLPERLQVISRPFCDLAYTLAATLPRNPERTVALRKLLESKDCAVRAVLFT